MIRNIKVDIVYYTIGSDFEMEFNLCGCCRMRLLTDTVNTRADFSKSLARGVNRSNIIIACGPIFGEKGLVSTVSKVTNIGTEIINNEQYGIDSKDEISVLKSSTPLVTSDGIFSGCIIENGPQVIILLSESKSIRKKVMKELIHPYITQWSFMGSDNNFPLNSTVKNQPAPIVVNEDAEEQNEEIDAENTPKNDDFILNIDFTGNENEAYQDDNSSNLPFNFPNNAEKQNLKYYLDDSDDSPFVPEEQKSPWFMFLIVFAIFVALLILFFGVIRPAYYGYNVFSFIRNALTPHLTTELSIFF